MARLSGESLVREAIAICFQDRKIEAATTFRVRNAMNQRILSKPRGTHRRVAMSCELNDPEHKKR